MASKHSWSTSVYTASAATRSAKGISDFDYVDSGTAAARGRVHDDLNPFGVTRESRDSDVCPQSKAIAIGLDETGSMGQVPRTLVKKLPLLHGVLTTGGYVAYPQIMFAGIGDATCDRSPLQVGQFEFGNEMDDDLGKLDLVGGGGGQKTESYELFLYFLARHTSIDCWDKRGERGIAVIIGDETCYPRVKAREVKTVIGDTLQDDIALADIVAEAQERWDIYYILPAGASYAGDPAILGHWRGLLGQNVIELDDLDATCDTIAVLVGLAEDAVDLDTGLDHLRKAGSDATAVVGKALATLDSGRAGGAVVSAPAPGDLDTGASGNARL